MGCCLPLPSALTSGAVLYLVQAFSALLTYLHCWHIISWTQSTVELLFSAIRPSVVLLNSANSNCCSVWCILLWRKGSIWLRVILKSSRITVSPVEHLFVNYKKRQKLQTKHWCSNCNGLVRLKECSHQRYYIKCCWNSQHLDQAVKFHEINLKHSISLLVNSRSS